MAGVKPRLKSGVWKRMEVFEGTQGDVGDPNRACFCSMCSTEAAYWGGSWRTPIGQYSGSNTGQ